MAQMEQEAAAEKPSKKPLIILVLAIILSLAAGAGGMFYYMKQQAAHAIEEACAEPPPPVITTIYNELEKPLIVNFPQGSSVKLVKITLAFSAGDAETIAVLKKNEPMLLNNLLMLLSAQNTDGLKTHEGKVALRNAIFDDVTEMLEKMSPEAEIKEVYFTSFIMQ
jgi:flagellar FliL protein